MRVLRLAAAMALLVGFGSLALSNFGLIPPMTAFFVTLVVQQLVLIGFELFVAIKWSPTSPFGSRAVAITAMIALSFVCAWLSNTVLLQHKPAVVPLFSNLVNCIFAIPALFAGVGGLFYSYSAQHR